ncbi:hypothetical protein AAG570_000583 [Ranatra chinensis]|uniref:HhH-GPD domain-containing protein n=1 Tax=Ranatra chinensis TaxID=642074 RepID=A0ABD0ZED4_9HEMI
MEDTSETIPCEVNIKNFHRRPGRLYKISGSSKALVKSKYFSEIKNHRDPNWIPPRSPYALIQEDLYSNPWQLLIATVFLTKTTAQRAIPQILKFLARWPVPEELVNASYDEVLSFFTPLGLEFLRTETVIRFTREYLEKDWMYPSELHGIGKYGNDSYRIFCINEWREVAPDDIPLTMYRNWLMENAEELGIS